MSTPFSQPAIPPQPNLEVYGVLALALFQAYTRDSYRTAFQVEAPAWDPSRVAKSWFDSTVDGSNPGNTATYKIVASGTSGWAIENLTMPAAEAASVNLPGAFLYAPYSVAPTGATRGGSPINPVYLSFEADARDLMATIGGTGLLDEGVTPVFPVAYPPDEPRRLWDILFKGNPVNAGAMLLSRNAKGVNSPGRWDTSGIWPIWVPAPPVPTGLDDTRPARPMPVRDLLPNENLQTGLMGVSVVRIDLQQQANEQAGQFTPDDRATLQRIFQIVRG